MKTVLLTALFLFACGTAIAQTSTPQVPATGTNPATPVPAAPTAAATPYTDQEFPPWVLKLRRAEILAVGAFPLAYLFAGLAYDYTYYLTSGLPQSNLPWPAGPGTSQWTVSAQPDLLQRKNITLVGMALGASLLVATLDWVLGF